MIKIVRSNIKTYSNVFRHTLYNDNDLYPYNISYLPHIYFQIFLWKYNRFFAFSYDFCYTFVDNFIFVFFKLIISIACCLKDSLNFFMQSLALHTSCLFYMFLNEEIVDIEKPDVVFSLNFVVDEFSGLFLYPSIFLLNIQDLHK